DLVEDELRPVHAGPCPVVPAELVGRPEGRGCTDAVGLPARARVGQGRAAVEAVGVAVARFGTRGDLLEVSPRAGLHAERRDRAGQTKEQVDAFGFRGPDAPTRARIVD